MRRELPFILLACSPLALAQEEDLSPSEPGNRWSASAELVLWRPALQDDLTVPGGGTVTLESVDLGENEITPALRTVFTNGDWDVRLEGFIFGTDGSGGEVDYASLELLVLREVWSETFSEDVGLRLALGGGLRASDMRAELTGGMGGPASDDSIWAEALGAARLGIDLPHEFSFDIHSAVGAGFKSAAWSIGARVLWQPEAYFGAQLGYRFLSTDLDDDGFEFDGALAGLYAGLVFEF